MIWYPHDRGAPACPCGRAVGEPPTSVRTWHRPCVPRWCPFSSYLWLYEHDILTSYLELLSLSYIREIMSIIGQQSQKERVCKVNNKMICFFCFSWIHRLHMEGKQKRWDTLLAKFQAAMPYRIHEIVGYKVLNVVRGFFICAAFTYRLQFLIPKTCWFKYL